MMVRLTFSDVSCYSEEKGYGKDEIDFRIVDLGAFIFFWGIFSRINPYLKAKERTTILHSSGLTHKVQCHLL